jgi:hypothetical protein
MRKVEAAAEQTAHVPPGVVWSLLSDVMVYPQWGPWRKSSYRSVGGGEGRGGFPELNAAPVPPSGGLHALGNSPPSWDGALRDMRQMSNFPVDGRIF